MYNDQLEPKTIAIDDMYLDPNNPRFWSEHSHKTPDVVDGKVVQDAQQTKSSERIREYGLEELKNSILRNGFLPLDRIVVRELAEQPGKFVAIEGNRRLAALKELREEIANDVIAEPNITKDSLEALRAATDHLEVLVYRGSDTADIAWILQGIRHISGIRDWLPAQQGKLVADQIDRDGLSLSEAGQRFGLTAQAVGRRYRSYKALEQMRADEEFQAKAENKYYSLFEEAVRQKEVKAWLGWDDATKTFTNETNLKQFYSWICPDEEHAENARRIHDPRHIALLGRILAARADVLIDKIDKHELTIEAAAQQLVDTDYKYDWESAFRRICLLIGDIPSSAIQKDANEIVSAIAEVEIAISDLKKMAASVARDSGKI